MKWTDFEKQARYDYWICKYVDERGELVHIRFVEHKGLSTSRLLEANGYVQCFSGPSADGYELPNYRRVLVKRDLSSEGPEGTIVATRLKDVFDKDGNKLGSIWDTKRCGVGGLDYDLIQPGNEPGWLKSIYLENKYVEFFEQLKAARWEKGYITQMTYKEVWDAVDDGKEQELLERAKHPKSARV